MKKIMAMLISAAIIIASFSVCLNAYALKTTNVPKTQIGTSDTYYEFDAATKTLTLSGNGEIPNMINNESSQPWFSWRSDGSIENIVIDEGITRVGNYVLYQINCANISIPSTLTAIGNYAFAYNSLVENIELPYGVISIGASAFENCIALKSVDIPDTVKTISKNAFKQCYKLESVFIPHSVQSIGNYAFHRCSVLESVTFESLSSPISIGSYAFMACPLLTEVSVPLNATLNTYAFGYNDNKKKYDGFLMKVYSGSDAIAYAKARTIDYIILDAIALSLGAVNKNEYFEETANYEYTYSFTPSVTQVYNIYSTGDVDLRAVMTCGDEEILESDDISKDNLNFCLRCELQEGREYIITVNSVKSLGEYAIIAYPDEITSFDIKGSLAFSAADGEVAEDGIRYFDINNDMLSDFLLTIDFGGDFQDIIPFENKYFDNKTIELADKQKESPFTCGNNSSYISIGEVESAFDVNIEHSYDEKVVEMTLDDDGYTLYTCILCADSYKDNFVPTTAVTVSGKAVIMEKPDGSHEHNTPYPYVSFEANDRVYHTDDEGNWSLRTFNSLDLVFVNENGNDVAVHIDVDGEDVYYGEVAFEGYDFTGDGIVNAKDFAVFLKQKEKSLGEDYWQYAANFI